MWSSLLLREESGRDLKEVRHAEREELKAKLAVSGGRREGVSNGLQSSKGLRWVLGRKKSEAVPCRMEL